MKDYRRGIITVYTPTFNRGYCLHQLYESLLRQTNVNFEWLVVDDGSSDNTESLILKWIEEAPFKISYFKQRNEGKMAKLNFIHQIVDSELCMCMDSDDYLLDNAIAEILNLWETVKSNNNIAGIVGLNVSKEGKVIGTEFPDKLCYTKFSRFNKYKIYGDKKFIYRTDIISSYPPYPSINGERFPAPGYLYRLIDVDYDIWLHNKPLSVVEYLGDGLSKNKYSQFIKSPNAFRFYRLERMRLAENYLDRLKNAIHFVSSSLFARKNIFKSNRFPFTTFLALPFGIILNIHIRKSKTKGVVK